MLCFGIDRDAKRGRVRGDHVEKSAHEQGPIPGLRLRGVVERFEDLPANAVMIVRGETERWVPVSDRHLVKIDAAARLIEVDWPEEL